jgi:uncharacterized protein YjiS (DUF1127 family)
MDAKLPPPLIVLPRQDLSMSRRRRDVRRAPALQGSVPTWANSLRTRIRSGFRMIGHWIVRAIRRDDLADLDDHLLRDIGVSSIDARSASAKPRISHEGWVLRRPPKSW